MEELQRKYNHAKKIISELKRHEHFLAGQLRERDQEYNSHLQALRERVILLERELATTQRVAGIPVRLPGYHGGTDGTLSPPEILKQPPVRLFVKPEFCDFKSETDKLTRTSKTLPIS